MSVEAIEAKLVALLAVPGVKKVLDYEPKRIDVFPCVTMYYDGFKQVRGKSFGQHQVTHSWIIRLNIPMTDEKAAQVAMKSITQAIAAALRQDITLSGTVLRGLLSAGDVLVAETANQAAMMIGQLIFEAEILV